MPFSQNEWLEGAMNGHPKEASGGIGNRAQTSCTAKQPLCSSHTLTQPLERWVAQRCCPPPIPERQSMCWYPCWEDEAKRG